MKALWMAGIVAAAAVFPTAARALPAVGAVAPPIKLLDAHGKAFDLSSLAGRQPVLVNFFTTG